MLETRLAEAEALSKFNHGLFKQYGLIRDDRKDLITAILFFDEANTTESIGMNDTYFYFEFQRYLYKS